MKNIIKDIKKDCLIAMAPAWIISTIETVITGIVSILIANFVAKFTDAIFQMDKEIFINKMWQIVLCIIISVVINPLISYLCNILMIRQAFKHDRKVMKRFLHKEYIDAMRLGVGEAQSRLENDPNDYRLKWMEMMTQFVSLPIVLIYLLYSTFKYNWIYALITIAISAIRILVPILARNLKAKYDSESREYTTKIRKNETNITSMPYYTVMFKLESGMLDRVNKTFFDYYNTIGKRKAVLDSIASFFSDVIDSVSILLIVLLGAIFVSRNLISAGTVAAMLGFSVIYNNVISAVTYIISEYPIMNNLINRMEKIYENQEADDGEYIENITNISVENVSYKYTNTTVFEPLSFFVHSGEKIAICGENGSGKSTLLHVLCGLNSGYTGTIKVDGRELSSLSLKSIRKQIAFVTQSPFFFSGTILENITCGNFKSPNDVMCVLENMGITYLANRDISVNQDSLSVGEKQRLSIARAILMDAPIILFDEPSNNLDSESLQYLINFIKTSNKTIIFVSHTEALTRLASKVVTVNKEKKD